MTTKTQASVETQELTVAIFVALLNMTAGDVDLQQPRTRNLVDRLHKVEAMHGNRFKVELTEEDMRSVRYILGVYTLNRPQLKTRFHRWLLNNSELYRRIEEEDNPS